MADVSDPLELAFTQESKEKELEREASLQEFREAVGRYDSVKDLVLAPGWPVFIQELEKRSAFWLARCQELLTAIVFKRESADEAAFAEARIHHLATEEAIFILAVMRVDASKAKEVLDKIQAEVRDSQQNG